MKKLFKDDEGIKYKILDSIYKNHTSGFAFKNVQWNTKKILNVKEKLGRIIIQQIYLCGKTI